MPQPVIKAVNLCKEYRLGTISHRTLTRDLQSWWARMRGRDDPNALLPSEFSNTASQTGNNAPDPARSVQPSDRFWALKNLSFEVHQGDVLGIIGENGAGKSTLLKVLSRVTTPSRGCVKIRGRIASLLEVGTGFHPELTGLENIFLNGAILGMSKPEIRRKLDEIISFAEVEKFVETPVKRYSSGMYVRLAFAVAAHLDPEILIVDEVLAVGDEAFRRKCLGKMKEVAVGGRTVLFVSHNMAAVRRLCSKGLVLAAGKIIHSGTAAEACDVYLRHFDKNHVARSNLDPGVLLDDRSPTLENGCCITKLQVLDSSGLSKINVRTWDYVRFRIEYVSEISLKIAAVVFQISSKDGVILSHTSTMPDFSIDHAIVPGRWLIDCIYKKFPLSSGDYVISAGLSSLEKA